MDWLDAATAALAIIAVPLALRYPLRAKDDSTVENLTCDCAATADAKPPQIFPQEEEPTQERQPDSTSESRR